MTAARGAVRAAAPCSSTLISTANLWTEPIWFSGFTPWIVTQAVTAVASSARRCGRLESGNSQCHEVSHVYSYLMLLICRVSLQSSFCARRAAGARAHPAVQLLRRQAALQQPGLGAVHRYGRLGYAATPASGAAAESGCGLLEFANQVRRSAQYMVESR